MEPLDRLSGLGGLPQGRLSVLRGRSGSGKSSVALAVLAKATRELAQAIVIDPYRRFDPWALMPFQPNFETLTVARPPDAACAAEAAIALARAGAAFLLVFLWDGGRASPNWLQSFDSVAARSGAVVLWVTEEVPAPLAHASSFTVEVARAGWAWERSQLVGLRARLQCIKNKVSAVAGLAGSELSAELDIRYPVGRLFPDLPQAPVSAEESETWAVQSAAG